MNNSIDIRKIREFQSKADLNDRENVKKKKANIFSILNKECHFGNPIPDAIKEEFYLELSSLLEAGVDIRSSMDLISENQTKAKYGDIFKAVIAEIISGVSFSNSLKQSGKFTTYEYYSIQIGEETGKLTTVFKELSIFYKKKVKQRRQIVGALTYPVIVLFIAFVSVSFMLAFVVPMFSDVFKRFGQNLPFATRLVVSLSMFVKKWIIPFLMILAIIILAAYRKRKSKAFRKLSADFLFKVPLIGKLISKIYLARFSNTMSLLIGAKIPILQSIQMCQKMIGYYPIENSLNEVENLILSGISLHRALSNFKVYPPKMIAMLKVGEDVNQLDKFFSKIADQYSEDIEHQTNVLSKFIEPVIIVVLGLVVGVILIAMYLPLFKLGQSI